MESANTYSVAFERVHYWAAQIGYFWCVQHIIRESSVWPDFPVTEAALIKNGLNHFNLIH
jgi:hypothetical protein